MKTELFTCAQTGLVRDARAERQAEIKRNEAIHLSAQHHRRAEIARICAQFELESDEFSTAEQKAQRIIGRR